MEQRSRLQISREQFESIFRHVGEAVLVTDGRTRLLLLSGKAARTFGLTNEDVGAPLGDLIDHPQLTSAILVVAAGERKEVRFDLAGRRRRTLRASICGVGGRGDRPDFVVATVRDITDLLRFDRLQSRFVAMAAHGLRTPLTSIRGFSEILRTRSGLDPGQRNRYLGMIENQANQLAGFIDDLLDVSKIEGGGGLKPEKSLVSLATLLREEVRMLREASQRHRYTLELPRRLPLLDCDEKQIRNVLRNLLSNATKYSPEGGEIVAQARLESSSVRVSISDEGIGMEPEEVGSAFLKFYRADTSNTSVEGTGLGLYIVKSLVESHGGRVWLESEPGRGTTASFTLPIGIPEKVGK